MADFTDLVAGRKMRIIGDSFTPRTDMPNGGGWMEENASLSRAFRATDENVGGGVAAAWLPNWGVTDYTFNVVLRRELNWNPTGFANYWLMAITNNAYTNARMTLYASSSTNLAMTMEGIPVANWVFPSTAVPHLCTLRIQSSNLAGGTRDSLRNGQVASNLAAHGITSVPVRSGTGNFAQFGGRNGASDFGVLGCGRVGRIFVAHRWMSQMEIIRIAREMGINR